MSPTITNPHIDEMYEEAERHGALGGKTTGAGGGGYLMLYCEYEKKHKVAEAMTRGGHPAEVGFEFHGQQTWRMNGNAGNGQRSANHPRKHCGQRGGQTSDARRR